ncbi:MAG TPA: hypothetical protein VEQ60_06365 [Longimicrobium sp.]|nr:hypothetical protein [Longimicrobium sp.]
MATRIQRPRITPTWRADLRRGTVRPEATLAFLRSPAMLEILRDANEQLRPWGVEPLVLQGVRQPFDYAPRTTRRIQLNPNPGE